MATDQEIRDAGILYLPRQNYLLNPFTIPQGEENNEDSNSGGITFTNVRQTGGNDNINPYGPLTPTFSSELGDPSNFRISDLEGTSDYFPATTMFGKIKEGIGSVFKPRIRGQLGDRLFRQSQAMTIPTLSGAFAKLRSPFNPESPTYNAALPSQLNFLEGALGTKVTGTSDNLKFTEGLALIGRDPNTGGLKYGPGSVLAGKNVISGFGTNDYETALNNYISKMISRGVLSKFQQAKLDQARKELANLQADQEEEYRTGGTREEVIDLQRRIDRGDFDKGETTNVTTTRPGITKGTTATGGYGGGADMGSAPSQGQKDAGPGFDDVGESGSFKKGGLAAILGF